MDAEMLKAKICGHRSVEDKKEQNKIWTHKYSSKKTACPRIRSLNHHAHFLDANFIYIFHLAHKTIKKIEAEEGSNHAHETLSEAHHPLGWQSTCVRPAH